MSESDEVVKEFLVESCEGLDRIDADLIALEDDAAPGPRIANIFRTIHTIKGTSGFLSFPKVEAISHVGENLLSRLRDGTLTPTPEIIAALLAMADALRGLLSTIETTGSEGTPEHSALVALLSRLANGEPRGDTAFELPPLGQAYSAAKPSPSPEVEPLVAEDSAVRDNLEEGRSPTLTDTTIRVQVGLLDKLMNLVGELVLARNQILQFAAANEDSTLLGATQRLNLLTTELQEGIMKTRMQPIGSIWNKFPRVVRELARACEKEVILEMVGKDTDLDRSIIEAIKDPLTHIVRNSIDHGIEKPAYRVSAGKRREGTLRLHAFHEGGKVNIEIGDDGGGIDPAKVRSKAIERGVISSERALRMTDRELVNLIFLPGFSTADTVSNVSGRGVGMDVVRTNIERIGGTVDLQSVPGTGATVRIKIPLTLAIIPALIVTAAGERYAIPQVSLVELVRLDGSESRGGIETIQGASLLRLRGNLLPLVYLGELLGESTRPDNQEINVVVLQSDERRFGLVVDGIVDTEEIVVKPLGKELKRVSVFAGATIMGDGKVALILDVLGIAQSANVISESRDRALKTGTQTAHATEDHAEALLLFRATDNRRMAIPLGLVARLEEIPSEAIERAGAEEVVQYRGDILPLVRLSNAFGDRPPANDTNAALQVIVYSDGRRRVGLVVGEILDIGEEAVRTREVKRGAAPVAIVQGRVTEFLDVGALLQTLRMDSGSNTQGEAQSC